MRVDLDALVVCYDPQPAYLGTLVPLPAAVRFRAEELAGRAVSLREAVRSLQEVTPGIVRAQGRRILLFLTLGYFENCWRVLQYRECSADEATPTAP